jgi:hypothetical protein
MAQDLITEAELATYGIAGGASSRGTSAQRLAAIAGASATVQAALAARYPLPWSAWDGLVKRWTARIAARELMNVVGWNPEDPANAELIALAREAHREALLAGKGAILVEITAAASTGDTVAPLEVLCDERQGW